LGPSGSGKTTLMNVISGLERATNGIVNVLGNNLINFNNTELTTFRRENIGYIFQQYGLLPNLTVKDNILLGEYLQVKNNKYYTKKYKKDLKKLKKQFVDSHDSVEYETQKDAITKEYYKNINLQSNVDKDYFLIANIMKILQIDNLSRKYPGQLSGGQQQRVSIARTLIKKPKILFADEPTGAVDTEMSKIIMNSLLEINKVMNTTIVIVTHNPAIAQLADKVIHFFDGTISEIVNNQHRKTVEEIK
ncbi:MAG: ABC transporter ATP-binding protein, partial [Mycoplasmoidaceae bacterium]|nr:ABC transporter ATP-binding protein [Mycoplasmoidaceae bacterium]